MCVLSHVRLFATVARQAPLSMENSPGKSTGVGCHFILQGIFPIQGSNLHLLRQQVDSLPLHHVGSPSIIIITAKSIDSYHMPDNMISDLHT